MADKQIDDLLCNFIYATTAFGWSVWLLIKWVGG